MGFDHDFQAQAVGFGNGAGQVARWVVGIVGKVGAQAAVVAQVGVGVDADPGNAHFFELGHSVDHGVAAPFAAVGGTGNGHAVDFVAGGLGVGASQQT
jgi:hypothetical protein